MKNFLSNKSTGTIVFLVMMALVSTSCSDLFEVENPNAVRAEQLDNPNLIETLSNSAEGALSQVYSRAVLVAAEPSDEVFSAQTQQAGDRFADKGLLEGNHTFWGDMWDNLAAARWTATNVTERLEGMLENPNANIGLARSYFWDAIARITLADMFRAIPFDNGPPNTPETVYVGAIERLIKANEIAKAAPSSPESTTYIAASYASIARAYRALYFERDGDMDAFAKAADFAEKALQTDPKFNLDIRIQTPGSQNNTYLHLSLLPYNSMDPKYAHLRDPVTGKLDSRIKRTEPDGVAQTGDSLFIQLKYEDDNSDVPVSRWQEAELIIAEYAILNNDMPSAVEHINNVREAAGLVSFSSKDPQEVEEQVRYERKAEFWLELRRWQDMRYYNIIPDRWAPQAKQLGPDRRYHVSLREKFANPNM